MPENIAMILLPTDVDDVAERLAAILAGTPPRLVQGHVLIRVPLDRLEAAVTGDLEEAA